MFTNLTVDGDAEEWTAGPTTVRGDVCIRASGVVRFAPGNYANVEGSYGPLYQPREIPSPSDCDPASGDGPATNCRDRSLVMAVVPQGDTPTFATGGGGITALQITRECYFTIEQLRTHAGTSGAVDLHFAFNDTDFSGNAGSYSVTVTVDKSKDLFKRDKPTDLEDARNGKRCSRSGFYYAGHGIRWEGERPVGRDFYKEN